MKKARLLTALSSKTIGCLGPSGLQRGHHLASKTFQSALLGVLALVAAARGGAALFTAHYVSSVRGGIVTLKGLPAQGMGAAYVAMGTALMAVALYQYAPWRRLALVVGVFSGVIILGGFGLGLRG